MKVIGTCDQVVRKHLPSLMWETVLKYSFRCFFVSWTGSLDPPEMALMMLTLLPEGVSIARSGICPGSSFGGGGKFVVSQESGVELLDHV